MLHVIFLVLSVLSGVGACLATGAFAGLRWLWLLPVGFAGTYLVLLLGFGLLLLILAASVDMEKDQKEDNAFYRAVAHGLISVGIPLLRVRVHTEGFENKKIDGRCLVVCNHLHELDPIFLLRAFPEQRLAFISKREVKKMPIVGPILHRMLGQFINRENDREALKTILSCVKILKAGKSSIGVFPEGYCSKDKKLHPLRGGVFKIAQKAEVPIVVCTLRDTHRILANVRHLKPSDVHLHLVGVIPAEEIRGVRAVDVAHRVHTMMADDLGPELVLREIPETP